MELSAELFEQTIRIFKGDGAAVKKQRRSQPRVGVRCHLKIVPVDAGNIGEPMEVWTRDISRSGIGLMTSQRLKIGSWFVVRFPRADEEAALSLVCTVKCCTQISHGIYAIGATFEGIDKSAAAAA
jgi:c-di-GMP-binding flagellar brake protein YcgR